MSPSGFIRVCTALVILIVSGEGWGEVERGKVVYEQKCAQCHGLTGLGDGPAAERVNPRPRDFTRGVFKLRGTASGSLPTDADLFRTITNGMPGTSMPAWGHLPEEDRHALVEYIKIFSARFKDEAVPAPLDLGKVPVASPAGIEQGKQLYTEMGCANCHGVSGRGNGQSVFSQEEDNAPWKHTMVDDWEHPIYPANFYKRWTYRGGAKEEDIRRAIATGLTGSPMGSFHGPDAFTVDEKAADAEKMTQANEKAWRLTQYLASLSPVAPNLGAVLTVKKVKGALPDDAASPVWTAAQPLDVPLVGQVVFEPRQFIPSIDLVTVRAVYNEQEIAWLIEWDDRIADQGDQLVLQFPVKAESGSTKPYFLGGDPRQPVEWWQVQPQSGAITSKICTGWPALDSKKDLKKQKNATSPNPFVSKMAYDDGRWRAVVTRSLTANDPAQSVTFNPDAFTPFAVFAWDAMNGDRGAKCSVSTWHSMRFEQEPPMTIWVYPPLTFLFVLGAEWWVARAVRRRSKPVS